jgi:tellurite resistance protein
VLNACRVTSMADTGIDDVKKQRNAEYAKQYRMKRKL